MANIFDYLTWRADVPLSVDPFNEVDNLVLAELSYTEFGNSVPNDGSEKTLAEVTEDFFKANDREDLKKVVSFTAESPFLLDDMAAGARFAAAIVSDYINIIDTDREEQMAAVTFRLPDGTIYVAFRGTDTTVVGWKEDFNLSYMPETAGQKRAVQYLNDIGRKYSGEIRVGGHSKGGNFAVYAATFCEPEIQNRIVEVWSNDGPGFREEVIQTPEFQRIFPRIRSIVPESSVIGMLLTTDYSRIVVKSNANVVMQHNGFTWELKRNRFEETKLSEFAIYVEETMSSWLSKMDDETRMSITNTVFSVVESTGMATFSEIIEKKWGSFKSVVTALRELPKEKQKELIAQSAELIQSGEKVVLARIPFINDRTK